VRCVNCNLDYGALSSSRCLGNEAMGEEVPGTYMKTGSQERLQEQGTLQSQEEKSVDEVKFRMYFSHCITFAGVA